MGKITHIYEQGGIYASAVEILLDNGQEITIGNSTSGIKIYDKILLFFPRVIWRCGNSPLIEKLFPVLGTKFIGSPIEAIAREIIERFRSKEELVNYLQNFNA